MFDSRHFRGFKAADDLLLSRDTSIRLHNAHALLVREVGNVEAADHEYEAMLVNRAVSSWSNPEESVLAWRSWIWLALRQNDMATAMRRLYGFSLGWDHSDRAIDHRESHIGVREVISLAS